MLPTQQLKTKSRTGARLLALRRRRFHRHGQAEIKRKAADEESIDAVMETLPDKEEPPTDDPPDSSRTDASELASSELSSARSNATEESGDALSVAGQLSPVVLASTNIMTPTSQYPHVAPVGHPPKRDWTRARVFAGTSWLILCVTMALLGMSVLPIRNQMPTLRWPTRLLGGHLRHLDPTDPGVSRKDDRQKYRTDPTRQPRCRTESAIVRRRAGIGFENNDEIWRTVKLLHTKDDGSLLHIEFLRPESWFAENDIRTGREVFIDLPEMEVMGDAKIISTGPSPPIEGGPGHVVIGRYRHIVSRIVELTVDGVEDKIGVTPNHPIWSEDRSDSFQPVHCARANNSGRLMTK